VRPEGIHLTLRFLGEIDDGTTKPIGQALDDLCARIDPIRFEAAGIGAFPTLARPRVIWVGVRTSEDRLARLQAAIEAEVGRYGEEAEDRAFHPHLTLGRVHRGATAADLARLSELLLRQEVGTLGSVEADGVSLIRSELTPAGARYTRLHMARLGGGA
jgi:2'-5' RNA ligase